MSIFKKIKRMTKNRIYAEPVHIKNIKECFFYHTIDLPGYGTIEGNWDLRKRVDEYLGNVDFKGKRVLEVGTANGFLTFEMEKKGAGVISHDLSKDYKWDIVPFAKSDYRSTLERFKESTEKLNNAYWFCHRLMNSRAKVVYSDIYNLPDKIGQVDIITFAAILLHLRDPFLALQRGLRFAREKVIIVEPLRAQPVEFNESYMRFLPDPQTLLPGETWWDLRPELIVRMIGVLGFEDTKVIYHSQIQKGRPIQMYTVVGQRTSG